MIQALRRGLEILDALAAGDAPMRCKTLADRLDVDVSTAHRLLETLGHLGYVTKDPRSKMYSLGVKPVGLARAYLGGLDVRALARPHLERLANETGECLNLAIRQGNRAVLVDRVSGTHRLTANTEIGQSEPLYCTAVGKALLVGHEEADVRRLLPKRLSQYTANSRTTVAEVLTDLAECRHRGWALDNEEYQNGIRCVASWVLDFEGNAAGAIGLSAPKARMSLNRATELGRILKDGAAEISARLGAIPEGNAQS